MNRTPCSSPAFRWLAAGAGLATALYASRAALTWLQYGHPPSPDMDEADRLLDEFIPTYEVVERHHVRVAAPAAIALAAACDMDLAQSAIIRGIFRGRELILGAQPDKVRSPRTLLAWAKELGWAVLAEIPDREVVFGAVTRPWEASPYSAHCHARSLPAFTNPVTQRSYGPCAPIRSAPRNLSPAPKPASRLPTKPPAKPSGDTGPWFRQVSK